MNGCVLAMLFLPCFIESNLGNLLTRFPQGELVACPAEPTIFPLLFVV